MYEICAQKKFQKDGGPATQLLGWRRKWNGRGGDGGGGDGGGGVGSGEAGGEENFNFFCA